MTPKRIQTIIAKKITGKIIPLHDETGHHYQFVESGKIVDSITQKLIIEKPHLRLWYAKKALEWMEQHERWQDVNDDTREDMFRRASFAGTRERDAAGDLGTAVHSIIKKYLELWIINKKRPENIKDIIDPLAHYKVFAGARSAEKLFNEQNITPIAIELVVGNDKLGIAGTLDFLALWDKKLIIGDWKTSNSVSEDYAIQISAYRHCFDYMTGLKIDGCLLIQLSKNHDQCDLYHIPNIRSAFRRYKDTANVYDWIYNKKRKLIKIKRKIQYEQPTPTGLCDDTATDPVLGNGSRETQTDGAPVLS